MEALTLGQLAELETRLRDADSRSNVHIPSNYTETIWALIAMARASLVNREDAERWRKLRLYHWSDGRDVLVVTRSRSVVLGHETYSGHFLDGAIDAAQPPKD